MVKGAALVDTWQWDKVLKEFGEKTESAPVSAFKHDPLHCAWTTVGEARAVGEVCSSTFLGSSTVSTDLPKSCWFAEVIQVSGYYAKVRPLGYSESQADEVEKYQTWIHYFDVKEIGHYSGRGILTMPPFHMKSTLHECKQRIHTELFGKLTMSADFLNLSDNISKQSEYHIGQKVEVRDKDCCSRLRVGEIVKQVGQRVFVRYWNSRKDQSTGYWVHEHSDFLKPEGWCKTVGAKISAPRNYKPPLLDVRQLKMSNTTGRVEVDMMFEMINPVRLDEIVVGRVTAVLLHGFFKCRIESSVSQPDLKTFLKGENDFHFHISSKYIFPCGTCAKYGQKLQAPFEYDNETFTWKEYFMSTGTKPLPLPGKSLLDHERQLRCGMWVEAVDSHDTQSVCPANIFAVLGPYAVKVRFPGWSPIYDQWKPVNSTELFPIGWCRCYGHPLTPAGKELKNLDYVFQYGDLWQEVEDAKPGPSQPKRIRTKRLRYSSESEMEADENVA